MDEKLEKVGEVNIENGLFETFTKNININNKNIEILMLYHNSIYYYRPAVFEVIEEP
jgi:hypothetical protein